MMDYLYILAFGSNLGNRELNCQRGEAALRKAGEILWVSRHLYTEPLKSTEFAVDENQSDFLNYIIQYQSPLAPAELYQNIVNIENEVGHDRKRRWAPRCLDIDILYAWTCDGKELVLQGELNIPHPEIVKRPFLQTLLKELSRAC